MIRGNKLNTSAVMAISAAILCSSPAAFAQETAPTPVVQPAAPVTVAPPIVVQTAPEVAPTSTVVAPPPAVRTIPDSALGEPVTRAQAPRAAVSRPAPSRAAPSQNAAPRRVEASPVTATPEAADADFAPASDDLIPSDANIEDTGAIAPVDQSEAPSLSDGNQDDWMIYGGIAAVLGLAGLGGVIASRRRRTRQNDYSPVDQIALAAAPANNPVARPMPVERPVPHVMQPVVSRPLVADRNLPPVTDPLFAHQAELGPVTDPMFSRQMDVPPVTDPMFAEHDDYEGNSSAGSAFDKRRTWSATSGDHDPVAREPEPA